MEKIKDFLFPTERNKYSPAVFKLKWLTLICAGFLTLESVTFFLESRVPVSASDLEAGAIMRAINRERSLRNLPELQSNDKLSAAAVAKTNDMIARKYFSHTNPEGEYIWPTIVAAGYSPYKVLGENLAIEFTNTESMVQAWMNSPTHRANVLNENFVDQGMGVGFGDTTKGEYYSAVTNTFGALMASKKPVSSQPEVKAATPPPSPTPTQAPKTPSPKPTPKPTPVPKTAGLDSSSLEISGRLEDGQIRLSVSVRATGSPEQVLAKIGYFQTALEEVAGSPKKYSGTLVATYWRGINDQSIEITALAGGSSQASLSYPLKLVSFSQLGQNQPQNLPLEQWAQKEEVKVPSQPGPTASRYPSFSTLYKYNRYITLTLGLLFLLLMLTDARIIVQKRLENWDKKISNIFVLILSLIIVALLYWL